MFSLQAQLAPRWTSIAPPMTLLHPFGMLQPSAPGFVAKAQLNEVGHTHTHTQLLSITVTMSDNLVDSSVLHQFLVDQS